jgi:uncharacterized protein (TIGR00369 family)
LTHDQEDTSTKGKRTLFGRRTGRGGGGDNVGERPGATTSPGSGPGGSERRVVWHNRRVTDAESTEAMVARVRATFDRQGMMATLGVEVVNVEPGRVELALRHDDRFSQQHGFLHAGAVASVLDTACGYAAYTVMPPEAAVLTATYTINLLAPAAGHRFAMTGEVVRAGRTLVVCRGDAFADGSQRPFAVMQATMSAVYRPGVSG